ncbi:MAG: MFS transporter [Candidatus Bathyarchaeia archaeon]
MKEHRANQLRLLATSHGLNHVYQLLTPVIMPQIAQEYALSETTTGLLLACFAVSYALLPVFAGYVSHVLGSRRVVSAGFVLTALAVAAMAFTDNLIVLALLFFAAGAGGSTYHPNGTPLLADAYAENRGRTLGLHQTGGALGSVIGPIATGALVLTFTWRHAVVILAIPGIVLAAILWLKIPPSKHDKKAVAEPLSKVNRFDLKTYAPALLFILASAVYVFGQRGIDSFGMLYFVNAKGIEYLAATALFSGVKLAGLFSAPLCGYLSDKFSRKSVLATLILVEAASLFAITATPAALVTLPCIVFGFAAYGLLAVSEALLADVAPEAHRNTIFGLNYTASFSSSIFLPPVLGWTADSFGFDFGFTLLAAVIPLSIIPLARIKITQQKKKPCDAAYQ